MKRIDLIKRLFPGEISGYAFEVYTQVDEVKRVRTYVILDGEIRRIYKLDELGIYTEELVDSLKEQGYIDLEQVKTLKKI